jgi:PAS domain S-box-containing protein
MSALAATSGPIIETSDLEVIVEYHPQVESLLGWERAKALGQSVSELLVAPADRAGYAEWRQQCLLHGDRPPCPLKEVRARHRDGREFSALLTLLAGPAETGRYRLSVRPIGDGLATGDQAAGSVASFRALLESFPVGVWIADRDGNVLQGNREAQRIWGGARYVGIPQFGDYRGWWPSTGQLIQPEEWALTRALRKGETLLEELVDIESFDGVRKTIVISAAPIRDGRGEIIGALVVNQDVSELKRVQEELKKGRDELEARVMARTAELSRANELMKEEIANRKRIEENLHFEKEFLTAVLNQIEDGIAACDANGRLTYFNRATMEFHGLPHKPLAPEEWTDYYNLFYADGETPLARDEIPLFMAFQGRPVRNLELVIAPKDRPSRRVLSSGQAIHDRNGNKIGAVVAMHDVTERRRAEAALRKQQFLLHYIINSVPHSIFWKDRDDRFLGGNQNFLETLGVRSAEEMIGRTDHDFFPKEQADHFVRCDIEVMESGIPMLNIEEPQNRADGTHTLLTSKVPLRDENGQVMGLLGIFADITDRKRMEEELAGAKEAAEAAAKAKSDFLTIISHELRTPLTLILGPLDMILARADGVPAATRIELERIQRNASRLFVLVNDILDFVRIEAGRVQVNWEYLDVSGLIGQIVADASSAAERAGIQLRFTDDARLGQAPLDRGKFEKIVLNLLGNALKFTPRGGRIDLRLKATERDFELSVIDSGPGIPVEQQALLFRRFQQLDTSTTRKYEGSGIGLALVKEFAELMGGTVGVESASGKGSRFFVCFARTADVAMTSKAAPVEAEGAPPIDHRTAAKQMWTASLETTLAAEPRRSQKSRILVVEDNADMREFLRQIIAEDYLVETAENGAQAWQVARTRPPDAIVSDVMMPEMDGYELVARLKADAQLKKIPVVLLTAKASREEVVEGLRSGADDYLGKPFAPAELKARLESVLRLYRMQWDLEATLKALRETQEQLIHTAKMGAVGTLIAGLSHELNNPLSAILMNVQALAETPSADEGLVKRLSRSIENQTRRCARLVHALLDFSRKRPAAREPISPAALFGRISEFCEPMARQRDIRLRFQEGDAKHLHVCVQEVETALLNLITNAMAASPAGGEILVKAEERIRAERDGVQISVVDTGSGIAEDVLPRIFDPFFTTKPPGQGTGLGLSLTRKIVDDHGGTIFVESKKDRGTRVEMWLPVAGGGDDSRP